jgi:hypothetical protein
MRLIFFLLHSDVEIATTSEAAAINSVYNNSATDLHPVQVLQEKLPASATVQVNAVSNAPRQSNHFVVYTDQVLEAEVRWCLKAVSKSLSIRSNNEDPELFKVMFPDSKIASDFSLGRDKMAYLLHYGIAPTFH